VQFEFNEEEHLYSVNGRVIPGTTRVLSHCGLIDYSMVRPYLLEQKKILGKNVHAATHFYDDNESLDWSTVRDEEKPYVDAWVEFRQITGFTPLLREYRDIMIVNGMKYGTTLDAFGFLFKELADIELKTGEPQSWHGLQTAAHVMGLTWEAIAKGIGPAASIMAASGEIDWPMSELARFFKAKRYVLQLRPRTNPPYKLWPFTRARDYYIYLAALTITHEKLELGQQIPVE